MIIIHITHNMWSICIRSAIKMRHTFGSSRFFPFLSSNENIVAAAIFSYLHTSWLYRDRCCVSHGLETCSNCAQTPSYTKKRWLCNIDRYRHPETFSFAGFVFVRPRAFPPPDTPPYLADDYRSGEFSSETQSSSRFVPSALTFPFSSFPRHYIFRPIIFGPTPQSLKPVGRGNA